MERIEEILDFSKEITSLSFKLNITDTTEGDMIALISYINSISSGQRYISIGRHDVGKSEIPHIHINVVTEEYTKTKNESRRRKTFFEKNYLDKIEDVSLKVKEVHDLEAFKKCMQYPLKEGKLIETPRLHKKFFNEFTHTELEYLIESAKALFQIKLDQDRRKQRALGKSNDLMTNVLLIVGDLKFDSYKQYKEFIYPAFFEGLEIEEYPEIQNLSKAVMKVA